jgi:electron-transferring-flavoprotein dehydrogenase
LLPELVFSGGALVGCDAGFLNASRVMGSHAAITTCMLDDEAAFDAIGAGRQHDGLAAYPAKFETSWLHEKLYKALNFKPFMGLGLVLGMLMVGIDQVLFKGRAPWTMHHKRADHEYLRPASSSSRSPIRSQMAS